MSRSAQTKIFEILRWPPPTPWGWGQTNNVTIELTDPINRGVGTLRIALRGSKVPKLGLLTF